MKAAPECSTKGKFFTTQVLELATIPYLSSHAAAAVQQ
jgi:hypothetical protein